MTAERRTTDQIHAALRRALDLGEHGVQACTYLDGELLLHDWVGLADKEVRVEVGPDTLFPVFSVTKAVTVLALHVQAERGFVDYDSPVVNYWPEFGQHGKTQILVRHVLTHTSGVPQMPEGADPVSVQDWDWMVAQLAALKPLYPPGAASSYQALSFGWLVGEVVRRTDPLGRRFEQFVQDEILDPLAIVDLWMSLPESEDHRVAVLASDFSAPTAAAAPLHHLATPPALGSRPDVYNLAEVRRAVMPGSGGIMTAHAVARLFALLANGGELEGVRLLSEERVRQFATLRPTIQEVDQVVGFHPRVGIGGLWVGGDGFPPGDPLFREHPAVIYHRGAGGSYGWADLDHRLSVGIVHNRLFTAHELADASDHPFGAFVTAVYEHAAQHVSSRSEAGTA